MNFWKSRLIACNHRSSCYGIAWAPCRKSEKVTSCSRQCAQRLDEILVSAVSGSKLWTWCPSTLHRCKVLQRHVETILMPSLMPCVSCYFFLLHLYTTYLTIIVFDVAHQCIFKWLPHRLLAQAEELKAAALKAKEESPQQAIRRQMHQALKVLKIWKPCLTINNMIKSWIINIIN